MNGQSDAQEDRKNRFFWRLINIDVLLLLLCYLLQEDVFVATLAKSKTIIGIVVAVLAFLGLVKSNALAEGFSSLSDLLRNRYARFTIAAVTVAVSVFASIVIYRPDLFKATLSITNSPAPPDRSRSWRLHRTRRQPTTGSTPFRSCMLLRPS